MTRFALSLALLGLHVAAADAAVLCARERQTQPRGSVRVRETCKRGEVTIGTLSLNVASADQAGNAAALGGLGPGAFEAAGRHISTTVSGLGPTGTRIV
jgi:hypothetical protein